MTCFLVASYTITDPSGYEPYPPAVAPTLEPHGGELVAADFERERIEGEAHPVTIIVRFPSRESARAWYNSDEYQAIVKLRTDHTVGTVVFAESASG